MRFRVEAQDGGDPKVDASPRDIVYTELAEIVANTEPQIIAQTDLRYGYFLLLENFPPLFDLQCKFSLYIILASLVKARSKYTSTQPGLLCHLGNFHFLHCGSPCVL